jgi:hypothetical protein
MATSSRHRWPASWLLTVAAVIVLWGQLTAAETKKVNDKVKEIAGTSEFLKDVPKYFATLKAVDPVRRRVTLLLDGHTKEFTWLLFPDAEVKVAGWWGRLEDFTPGDRVWAWFQTNRKGQPVGVFMLADELSEQDIHGTGVTITSLAEGKITIKDAKDKSRVLKTDKTVAYRGQGGDSKDQSKPAKVPVQSFRKGSRVYVQSAGDQARLLFDRSAFALHQAAQKAALRKVWRAKGLPGTVLFVHLSGEMEYMLDHEAMRWGRSLNPGDQVSLLVGSGVKAVVKEVHPWRERTQVRLVVGSPDLGDLAIGMRVPLKMKAPPAAVDNSRFPADLGRRTNKKERIEWFLASIYCSCPRDKDICTGHFYTLASCNPNACGTPNQIRRQIVDKIDKGLSDKQIFEELVKEHGADLLRPHLLP